MTDETVYADDVALHFTDAGTNTVSRVISTLPGTWAGPGHRANCGSYRYCIGNPYGFGWAATGFAQDSKQAVAVSASLEIAPWLREPDTRSHQRPEPLRGMLTAIGLTKGAHYDVYRWDSVDLAFTYSADYKKATFTATSEKHIYVDPDSFPSNGTTYYRVVPAE